MKKIFCVTAILILLYSCKHNRNTNNGDILASHVDTLVQPGDDFNLFANGLWYKQNPIPAAYSSWGIGDLIDEDIREKVKSINEKALKAKAAPGSNEQKIGDFYFAGMDTLTIEKLGLSPLSPIMAKVDALKNMHDAAALVAYLHTLGIPVFFDAYVYQDAKNSDRNVLYFYQGGIGLPDKDYYFPADEHTTSIRNSYRDEYIPKMCDFVRVSPKNIFSLEEKFATASRELEELRDPYANYNSMTVEQLQLKYPAFQWRTYLDEIGATNTKDVVVGQPEFLAALQAIFSNEKDIDILKAYMKFMALNSYAKYLNKTVQGERFNFYGKKLSGQKEQLPRWKRILIAEEDAMGEILGQQFVKDYFPKEAKLRYENMVHNVINAYRERIKKLDWMSDSTKQKALEKLASVKMKVGYPDKWKDFSAMKISRTSYCDNMIAVNRWWHNYEIAKLNKPVDRNEWDMTPQTYNAYYNPSNNEIVLPAGIFLIPGIADADADDAMVYGYAGASTIGHEITHGFDDEGRQFDKKGNLNSWWTVEDEAKFKEKAQRLVSQFNNFTVNGKKVNGEATLGENIADLGGIRIGLDAFLQTESYKQNKMIGGYTPLQRFFLGYALGWMYHHTDEYMAEKILSDVHAPTHLRINAPFANIPEFNTAFDVSPGDKMYIADTARVKIW